MYNQQQMQMAANPTQQTEQAYQVAPGQAPFIPQIQLPGPLHDYYQFIVSLLVIELQTKMGQSPARMHAFNLMAHGGYRTQEFVNFCQLYCTYLDAWMRAGPGAQQHITVEAAIQATLPEFVGMYCLASVKDFQYIFQFLDPNAQQLVNPAINGMENVMRLIAHANAMGQQMQGGMVQQFSNGQLSGNFPTMGQQHPRTINTGMARATGSTAGAQGLFDNNRTTTVASRQAPTLNHTGEKSRFQKQLDAALAKQNGGMQAAAHTQQPVKEFVAPTPTGVPKPSFRMPPTTVKEEVKTEVQPPAPAPQPPVELKWKPSEKQPYRVLFDFTKFKEKLTTVDGTVITVTLPLPTEELNQMNIEDHALTKPPMPRYDAAGFDPKGAELVGATVDEVKPLPKFELEFADSRMIELSTSVTSTITGLRYRISKGNNTRASAKCYPVVMVDCLAVEDKSKIERYNKLIADLSECHTFQAACNLLDEIADSPDDRRFFNRLDRLLADELNIVMQMNISGFRIDSFYSDQHEILPELAKRRGEGVAQTFAASQRRFFQQLTASYSEEELRENTQFMLQEYVHNQDENPDKWDADLAILAWETSYTHLMLPSYELNITLKPGGAGILTEQTTPELYSLAEQILNQEDCEDFRRHYIVTSDGLQLMLARGYLNNDAFLIRRVREVA